MFTSLRSIKKKKGLTFDKKSINPFQTLYVCVCGWGGGVQRVGRCVPRLLGFILLLSFSDTLLVVSILDSLWLPFLAAFAVGTMGPFWPGDNPFQTWGESLWAVSKLESPAHLASLPRFFLLHWHFTCV